MQPIEPQALMLQTMQLISDNPEKYDQDVTWRCGTSHCWGGFSNMILTNMPIEFEFDETEPGYNERGEIYDRIRQAYRFTDVALGVFICTENSLEELRRYTKVFCDPIASVNTLELNPSELLVLLSRPDLSVEIATSAVSSYLSRQIFEVKYLSREMRDAVLMNKSLQNDPGILEMLNK